MTAVPKRLAEMSVRISQAPASADRCRLTAIALQKQGRIDQAISLYLRGLALNPSDASAYRCLGTAYKTRKQLDLAAACFRRAVELCPAFPEAWNNLGNTLAEQQDDAGAAACFERAFTVQPHFAGAHFNFAKRSDDSAGSTKRLPLAAGRRELSPRSAEFYNGLGMALYDARRIDEAVAAYDQAVRLRPDFAPARYNRSHAWLLLGDYARGWPEYEWRWKLPAVALPSFPQPRWDGTSQPDRTILLDAEQGLGDTIQFIRYVPLVKERVGTIVLRCQKPLVRLLAAMPGIDRVISQDEPTGPFDVWSPLLSLPLFFTPTLEAIPNRVPYLPEDQALVRFWQERLERIDGLRIGINWQGNPAFPKDRFRSVPLRYFEPLARIAGVRLISLQKGVGREQLEDRTCDIPRARPGALAGRNPRPVPRYGGHFAVPRPCDHVRHVARPSRRGARRRDVAGRAERSRVALAAGPAKTVRGTRRCVYSGRTGRANGPTSSRGWLPGSASASRREGQTHSAARKVFPVPRVENSRIQAGS